MAQSMAQYVAEQAEARGREEGRAEGTRSTLLRIGSKRFGEANEQVRSALEALTSLEQLDQLTDRLFEVESWDALMDASSE